MYQCHNVNKVALTYISASLDFYVKYYYYVCEMFADGQYMESCKCKHSFIKEHHIQGFMCILASADIY
jgi:hypothetical protein